MANIHGQLVKAILEKQASNPTGDDAVEGLIYYNTTSKEAKVHNGTAFKTVVDTDTAQTLSNKEHDVATLVQQSTPSTPAAGKAKLYIKTDKKLRLLNEAGEESFVGDEQAVVTLNNQGSTPSTPASGKSKIYVKDTSVKFLAEDGLERTIGEGTDTGINYITNAKAEYNTTGWSTSNNSASTPDGSTTGTSALTWTRSTSTPLRGNASFLLTRTANSLGSASYFNFTIDESDKGKVLQGSFEYKVASGTYADDELQVWIYHIDAVNGDRLIQPAPFKIKNSGIVEKFPFEFQAQGGTTATKTYRLIIHCSTSTATPFSMQFDNFSIGPNAKSYGSALTEPVTKTYSLTNAGNATVTGTVHQEGSFGVFKGKIVIGATPPTGEIILNLPSGYVMSTAAELKNASVVGYAGTGIYSGGARADSTTSIKFYGSTSTANAWSASVPGTWSSGSGNYIEFTIKAKMEGWSSSQIMSSDAATSVVAASYINITAGSVTAVNSATSAAIVKFLTKESDHLGLYNTSTGVLTCKTPGLYKVNARAFLSSAAGGDWQLGIYKNGVLFTNGDIVKASNAGYARVDGALELLANDTVDIRAQLNTGSSTVTLSATVGNSLVVERSSGPSQIMASESISCRYTNSAGTAFTSTPSTIPFATKEWDSHNAWTGTSYIAPISGEYEINLGLVLTSISYTTTQIPLNANVLVAGVAKGNIFRTKGDGVAFNYQGTNSRKVKALAGQAITVTLATDVNNTLIADASFNYIEINRVGNY